MDPRKPFGCRNEKKGRISQTKRRKTCDWYAQLRRYDINIKHYLKGKESCCFLPQPRA